MQAFYDKKPSVLEAVGNGSYLYRYNIEETEAPATDGNAEGEARKQWTCKEVTVWSPVTSNKITQAVIAAEWDSDYEQKLVNEYNAAALGLYGSKTSDEAKERTAAYKSFLEARATLKAQVDADCAELGVK